MYDNVGAGHNAQCQYLYSLVTHVQFVVAHVNGDDLVEQQEKYDDVDGKESFLGGTVSKGNVLGDAIVDSTLEHGEEFIV